MPDERVDLAQRQGRRGPAVEPEEAVGGHAELERGVGGLFGDGGTVLPGEGEDAEDATDAGGAVVTVDVVADGGDGGAGPLGGGEKGESLRRGAGGPVSVLDAMPAPRRAQVLAEELAGAGIAAQYLRVATTTRSARPRARSISSHSPNQNAPRTSTEQRPCHAPRSPWRRSSAATATPSGPRSGPPSRRRSAA